MEGFFGGDNYSCIDRTFYNGSSVSLLVKNSSFEIMLWEITPDTVSNIIPGESSGLIEFFYIIHGLITINLEQKTKILKAGDYFYISDLKKAIPFSTANGAFLLYVTTQPMFNDLASFQYELARLLEKTEEKDIYTHSHGRRVQNYSIKIMHKLKLPNSITETLALSSLFHDIGKCNVPDAILNKPGKLTDEEFKYIRSHPEESGKILEGKLSSEMCKIIEQHHERNNGSGYPKGLKGDEITLEARIIAVADSYDAMTSDRAYRKAMEPEIAINELKSLAGIMYDEAIVYALEQVLIDEGFYNNHNKNI